MEGTCGNPFLKGHPNMAMTANERRQFFRVEVDSPARFRMIEEKTSKPLTVWMNGSTSDVGLGGLKIVAPMSKAEMEMLVNRYSLIELSFRLPGASKEILATASIAYFLRGPMKSKAITVTFGVSFVKIENSAKDALGEFIRHLIETPV